MENELMCKVCGGAHATGACTENGHDTSPESKKVDAVATHEFIIKLAGDEGLDENRAVDSMVEQIRLLEGDPHFPDIVNALDPEQHDSSTKMLGETGKRRLRDALDKYAKESAA